MKDLGIIKKKETVFVLVDMQEKFIPVMKEIDKIIKNINILSESSDILEIPLIITEQYPRGLGNTSDKIKVFGNVTKIEKIDFSCFGCEEFNNKIKTMNAKNIVLFGVESHVCILKTALDALSKDYIVHIVADAITSRTKENKALAIERLQQSGAFIVSTEMILFQLLDKAGTEEFKSISKLIK